MQLRRKCRHRYFFIRNVKFKVLVLKSDKDGQWAIANKKSKAQKESQGQR